MVDTVNTTMGLLVAQKNPMVIYTVLENVLEHLDLRDIKQFRLVCHLWNYASEPFLRKRAKIGLSFLLHPEDFVRKYANHLQALPFRDFKLYVDEPFYQKLYDFLEEWDDIRSLHFGSPTLLPGYQQRDYYHFIYGISDLIKLVSYKLVTIEVSGYQYILSLGTLSGIPNIILQNCDVSIEYMDNKINPVTIVLEGVNFMDDGGKIPYIVYNEFIDFSRCSYMNMDASFINNNQIFDLSAETINANKIILQDVRLIGSANINIKADYFKVSSLNFHERLNINVRQLELKRCFVVLSQIPTLVEHLMLVEAKCIAFAIEPCALQNLKYLRIVFPHSQSFFHLKAIEKFRILRHFRNSQIIGLELEILQYEVLIREISLRWLPKGLQTLKFVRPMKFKLIPGVESIHVNVLILQHCTASCVAKLMRRISTNILIVSMVNDLSDIMDDLILFLLTVRQVKKLVLACANGFENDELFERAPISKFVNINSRFYEFENGIGKAISAKAFERYVAL